MVTSLHADEVFHTVDGGCRSCLGGTCGVRRYIRRNCVRERAGHIRTLTTGYSIFVTII